MSEKKIASFEDLLGDANETKEVVLDGGNIVVIKKLVLGDIAKINSYNVSKKYGDDPYRMTIGMLVRGVVQPKLAYSQAEKLKIDVATEIANAITDYAGWGKDRGDEVRNLSEKTTEPTL